MVTKVATYRAFKRFTLAVARGERKVDPKGPKIWVEPAAGVKAAGPIESRRATMTIARKDLDAGPANLSGIATGRRRAPIHPGEILAEEFMKPLGLSSSALARALGVPPRRISAIVAGRRDIAAETALRLARYFGTSAALWLGLQQHHDLEAARRTHAKAIARAVKPRAA